MNGLTPEQIQTGYNLFISIVGYVAPIAIVMAVSMKLMHMFVRGVVGKY